MGENRQESARDVPQASASRWHRSRRGGRMVVDTFGPEESAPVPQVDEGSAPSNMSDELRQSEEHYRTLFELAPDVIFSLSATDGTFTALSPAFEKITGWKVSD